MLSDYNALFERAFAVLNKVYFGGALPQPVITIQSSPKAYGYITEDKVWTDKQKAYHEINISAEHLTRPLVQVFATLQHELCHLYAMVSDIDDTSKGGRYHNKKFKAIAEARGLQIDYVPYIGFSKTTPTAQFIEVLKQYGLLDYTIDVCRGTLPYPVADNTGDDSTSGNSLSLPKKKSSTRKYVCSSCGISVRATKDVNIACMDCDNVMIKID